ncbi:MAG: acyltransferase [Boseongicola sp.]|nr:acyltransferase [Boseongicola sp.]
MRALAAWLVVFYHFYQIVPEFPPTSFTSFFLVAFGSFGVDIFFVLSGFIMVHALSIRPRNARSFLVERLLRIAPAYWAATFAFVLIVFSVPLPSSVNSEFGLFHLLKSLLFVSYIDAVPGTRAPFLVVGWTLNFEVFFYALITASVLFFGKMWAWPCVMLLLSAPFLVEAKLGLGYILSSFYLCEFAAGLVVGLLFVRHPRLFSRQLWWLGPVFLVWAAVVLLWGGVALGGVFVGERLIAAVLLLVGALLLEGKRTGLPGIGIALRLGKISYSTYVIHFPIQVCIAYLFESRFMAVSEPIALAIMVLAVWLASEMLYRLVETSPLVDRLRQLGAEPGRKLDAVTPR